MYTTLAEVRIESLAKFIGIFATNGAMMRSRHGSLGASVVATREPGRVFVLIDWPNEEAFAAFRNDPEVPGIMASGARWDRRPSPPSSGWQHCPSEPSTRRSVVPQWNLHAGRTFSTRTVSTGKDFPWPARTTTS
jgi:quinol monooxygenase YgiN